MELLLQVRICVRLLYHTAVLLVVYLQDTCLPRKNMQGEELTDVAEILKCKCKCYIGNREAH